jgi:predicted DNA-binding transcriptional regulator AlpA
MPDAGQIRLALNAAEAAAAIGLSERGFRRGLAAGRIPRGVKIGGRSVWPISVLDAWLAAGAPPDSDWEAGAAGGGRFPLTTRKTPGTWST